MLKEELLCYFPGARVYEINIVPCLYKIETTTFVVYVINEYPCLRSKKGMTVNSFEYEQSDCLDSHQKMLYKPLISCGSLVLLEYKKSLFATTKSSKFNLFDKIIFQTKKDVTQWKTPDWKLIILAYRLIVLSARFIEQAHTHS